MRRRQHVNCNFFNVETLSLSLAPHPVFYTQAGDYFVGDADLGKAAKKVHYDLTAQGISLGQFRAEKKTKSVIKEFQKFVYGASVCIYKKLKFTGKGYKVKKTKLKKSFKLYFGRSHVQYAFSGGVKLRKLSKYRLLLIGNVRKKINRITTLLLSARMLNRYTKRGFRCTRQFILKRPGKKSTY